MFLVRILYVCRRDFIYVHTLSPATIPSSCRPFSHLHRSTAAKMLLRASDGCLRRRFCYCITAFRFAYCWKRKRLCTRHRVNIKLRALYLFVVFSVFFSPSFESFMFCNIPSTHRHTNDRYGGVQNFHIRSNIRMLSNEPSAQPQVHTV